MKRIRSAIINGKRHRVVWQNTLKNKKFGDAWVDYCRITIHSNMDERSIV